MLPEGIGRKPRNLSDCSSSVVGTPPVQVLISVHIPKCAGTSFRTILRGIFGDKLWLNYGAAYRREEVRPGVVPPGTECIHGHFLADAFDVVFKNPRLVTWVRHPVERVVSNFQFFLRHPYNGDYFSRELHSKKLSLRQFSDMEGMRNEAARHFAGKTVDDFSFVGIADRFAESMRHFGQTFGFANLESVPVPRENVNPARPARRYRLDPGDYRYILDRNASDLAFFDEAMARLDAFADPR